MTRSETRRAVLTVDVDDVYTDRLSVIVNLRGKVMPVGSRGPSTWDLRDWDVHGHVHFERWHYRAFVERPGYRTMRLPPVAIAALHALHANGYLIRILTGRLWTTAITARVLGDTDAWVEANRISAQHISLLTDNAAVHTDEYVEDGPRFVTHFLRWAVG
jgi:hypothetical protein